MKSTKKSLLLSALSLMLCVAMLLGTTYAWFTDSVTSGKNIIKAGNLDIAMYYADGTKDVPTTVGEGGWLDASDATIFNYSLWEPGYTDVKHIKIANIGTLALKYQLAIVADGDLGILANVLDVYVTDTATKIAERSDLASMIKIGTLSQVLANDSLDLTGNLMPAGTEGKTSENTLTIAIKMQEEAGNEYQKLSVANGFTVVVKATQYTYEKDSFNNQYDKVAAWIGGSDAEGLAANTDGSAKTVKIETADQLAAFAANVNAGNSYKGYTVTLENNIDLNNVAWTPIGTNTKVFEGTFDGNGKTVSNLNVNKELQAGFFGRFNTPAVVKNLTIKNATVKGEAEVGVLAGCAYTGLVENCKITGLIKVDGNYQTGGMAGYGYANIDNVDIDAAEGSYVKATYLEANREGDAVGGLIGYSAEGSMYIKNSDVKGLTVTGTRKVGGVVGQIGGGTGRLVDACTFDGTVTVDGPDDYFTDNSGKIYAGGIIGELTSGNVTISNCIAKGTVTGKESAHTKEIIGGTRNGALKITETDNDGSGMTVN